MEDKPIRVVQGDGRVVVADNSVLEPTRLVFRFSGRNRVEAQSQVPSLSDTEDVEL